MKLSRSWLMTLCVVGMGAVLVLPALGISLGSLLAFLLVLLCPLSHLLMMRGMGGHGGHGGRDQGTGAGQQSPLPGAQASLPTEEKDAVKGGTGSA
ncbi:MAG: DUF2933 domain-containing protein [candidate division NC10 bacterium]|nr:DUF2933 domain-containing protein [candidate division NC10 bacterium]